MQPPSLDRVLERLNPSQRRAACHGESPLLIIAGAGTGKTTTLVHRVAYLIGQGIAPYRILLLTFTRRAAGEMLRRVEQILPEHNESRAVWGGTFHAMGTRLLRIYGQAVGINPRFTIHDRGDSEDLMRSLVAESKLDGGDRKFPKKGTCMAIHSYSVNAGQSLDEVLKSQFYTHRQYLDQLRQLFDLYRHRKSELAVFDYDDLLVKWCELLDHAEVGEQIRRRFDGVLVDEYQDTNRLQGDLLRRLCPRGTGLTVVGDDAQSIYSFRAATVRNILDFPKQFPGTQVVKLQQNYRSTEPLLEASNRVIAEARERYVKKLWSKRKPGSAPQLISCFDEVEQVQFVVARILEHQRGGISLSKQAVLFRASHHSIALEAELARHDIPFVKYGGLKFVEAAHIKDVIAFLRLAENPRDWVCGLRVLALLPGIGPRKAAQLMESLEESQGRFSCWAQSKPPAATAELWPAFVGLIEGLAEDSAGELAGQLDRVIDFYQPLLEQKYDNAPARLSDLGQLVAIADQFSDRTTLLADLAIDPPTSEAELPRNRRDEDHLVLSTMHSAKGLEWPVVYVIHASDGMIPDERSFRDDDLLEEERRMFYVALTRAADWLYVCHAENHWGRYRRRGADWDHDEDGSRPLTRFVTPSVQQAFECQRAGDRVTG